MSLKFSLLVGLLLLAGCQPSPGLTTPAGSPDVLAPLNTPTRPPTQTPAPAATVTLSPTPAPRYVLLVSIDGLRPEAIAMAPMPNLQQLIQDGAYSLSAQTVHPSATLPAHASMLLGACPDSHGVDWNDYLPARGAANGTSIFTLAKQAGLKTALLAGKQKLVQLTPPESLDAYQFIPDRDVVIAGAAAPLLAEGYHLFFVHFPTVDWMGHAYGWLSWEQFSVARRADEGLGTLLAALEAAGLRSQTLVIVTADHGGHDQLHGTRRPEDMTIPWVVQGPGVTPGELTAPVNITDTAATIAYFLGLPVPAGWDGLPVLEVFGGQSGLRPNPRCP